MSPSSKFLSFYLSFSYFSTIQKLQPLKCFKMQVFFLTEEHNPKRDFPRSYSNDLAITRWARINSSRFRMCNLLNILLFNFTVGNRKNDMIVIFFALVSKQFNQSSSYCRPLGFNLAKRVEVFVYQRQYTYPSIIPEINIDFSVSSRQKQRKAFSFYIRNSEASV